MMITRESPPASRRPLRCCLIAGEESGDRLGAALIRSLRRRQPAAQFFGVGGRDMEQEGFHGLFPIADIAVAGFANPVRRLPLILRRIREAARAVVEGDPDVLVIIDSPDFTHRVARLVRRRIRNLPIVDYVSPTVWAWRPGRARKMRAYVDHVMALLPFEPGVHRELGGPLCSYVGHPLIEQSASLRPNASESARRETGPPVLLVLPGSRTSELHRLIDPFHAAVRLIEARMGALDLVLPTVAHLEGEVRRLTSNWERVPRVIVEAEQKRAAFRIARAALAASGTVTLELALAGVPHVVAYRMSGWEAFIIRRLARAPSVVLTNLILGQKVVPEFLQEACEPGALAQATLELLSDSPARRAQTAAFCRLDGVMASAGGAPSEQAADIVIAMALGGRDYLRREIGA